MKCISKQHLKIGNSHSEFLVCSLHNDTYILRRWFRNIRHRMDCCEPENKIYHTSNMYTFKIIIRHIRCFSYNLQEVLIFEEDPHCRVYNTDGLVFKFLFIIKLVMESDWFLLFPICCWVTSPVFFKII